MLKKFCLPGSYEGKYIHFKVREIFLVEFFFHNFLLPLLSIEMVQNVIVIYYPHSFSFKVMCVDIYILFNIYKANQYLNKDVIKIMKSFKVDLQIHNLQIILLKCKFNLEKAFISKLFKNLEFNDKVILMSC